MASRSSRFFRAVGYASAAGAVGAGGLYMAYRPREIPGTEAAAVPPPTYGEGGVFNPPSFPKIKSRAAQIADLKASAGAVTGALKDAGQKVAKAVVGSSGDVQADNQGDKSDEYDLLIIGAGATGTGIALDAATRGLKVAMVERDDFASGTSSKSTKLVHGGVRYLEKAVWELDYNQCVPSLMTCARTFLDGVPPYLP
jgi:glycerol-3-phosphate dehydrogenase